jgi:MinD-like ATPase involved in chromosome partitioning or flagellar assembly
MSTDTVPRWPRIDAIVREDGSGEVTIDGTFHPITTGSLEEARVEVLRRVTENAAKVGRPVRASATGPEGLWNLIVHPDGTVVPEEDELAPPSTPTPQTPDAVPGSAPATTHGGMPGGAPGATPGATSSPTSAPGPVFEGTPVVDLPPRGEQADPFGSADPLDTTHPAGTAGVPGTNGAPGSTGGAGAGSDPLASAVEIDPEDTVRRVPRTPAAPDAGGPGSATPDSATPDSATRDSATPGPTTTGSATLGYTSSGSATAYAPNGATPEADGGSPVADWVRENASDDTRIRPAAGEPGGMPIGTPGSTMSGAPGGLATPVSGPVDAVPTAGYSGGGLSAPPSDPTPVTDGDAPRSRREARQSFLTHQQDEDPATRGFRGMLTKVGIRVGPSESERAERADERAVSQHWPGPRTISIVNGKGGAGKTPSTVLLAAVFAQFGGAGVVTWDNNQTRGTLGWRTEQGPHEATLLDLLPQADRLLGPSAQAADLARYVHHQTRDRFDVLRSKPIAMANEQRIEPRDVDAIHSVLSKYYRMILIDSGNDESDPMWQRMIDLTDQLVVATTTRDDHAEAGALLLEALSTRDGRSAYLAQQAVVVVSQADQKEPASELEKVADGYRSLAREVVTIPFDPAMVDGHLRYGALRTDTRRAWLKAGAAVAGGL